MRTSRERLRLACRSDFFIINTLERQDLNFNADKPREAAPRLSFRFFYYKQARRTGFEL